jgi:hypothetical protein
VHILRSKVKFFEFLFEKQFYTGIFLLSQIWAYPDFYQQLRGKSFWEKKWALWGFYYLLLGKRFRDKSHPLQYATAPSPSTIGKQTLLFSKS